jgi:hypothetical protein
LQIAAAIALAALKCVIEQFGDIGLYAEHAVACAKGREKSLRTKTIVVLKQFDRTSWAK